MGLFTNFWKWDLFVIYMFICVIFLGSCCVWVSCMFLFYPAKNHNEIKKSKELTNQNEKDKQEGARSNSINYFRRCGNYNPLNEQRSFRSKSINVDSFPSSIHALSDNTINAFSFRAVVEPLPNHSLREKMPEAGSLAKEKDLSQHPHQKLTFKKNRNLSNENEET